jgi:hypothetical protein
MIICGADHNLFLLLDTFGFFFLSLLVSRTNKVALQIINVTLEVHQVLFVFSIDLDSSKALGCKLLGIVDIYNLVIFLFVFLLGIDNLLIVFSVSHLIFFVSNFLTCRHLAQSIFFFREPLGV